MQRTPFYNFVYFIDAYLHSTRVFYLVVFVALWIEVEVFRFVSNITLHVFYTDVCVWKADITSHMVNISSVKVRLVSVKSRDWRCCLLKRPHFFSVASSDFTGIRRMSRCTKRLVLSSMLSQTSGLTVIHLIFFKVFFLAVWFNVDGDDEPKTLHWFQTDSL